MFPSKSSGVQVSVSSRHRVVATLISLCVTGAAAAAITSPASAGDAPRLGSGPHSPQDRVPAETSVARTQGTIEREVDLGDVELGRMAGQHRSPVRGVSLAQRGYSVLIPGLGAPLHRRQPDRPV